MSRWKSLFQPRCWGQLARAAFGEVRWSPPSWPLSVFDSMRKHPGRWASVIVGTAVTYVSAVQGYDWWQKHKPRPRVLVELREAKASLSASSHSRLIEGRVIPSPADVHFSQPVAKVEWVRHAEPPGITLSPAHPGRWIWESDRELSFKPKEEWPAGTSFTVTLDSSLLPKEVKIADGTEWTFTTGPFVAEWREAKFYTNPADPTIHEITAELQLTHPMSLEAAQRAVTVNSISGVNRFATGGAPFTLTEVKDSAQRRYYLRTARLVLPDKEDFIRLNFARNTLSSVGGAGTAEDRWEKVRVPDIYSGFTIAKISTELIRTSEGEPEQFLFIDTSGYATPEEIAQHTTAWFRPAGFAINATPVWEPKGNLHPAYARALKTVPLKSIETQKEDKAPLATRHGFKFLQEQPGQLLVQVRQGAKALGGFILANSTRQEVNVPSFPKEVEVLGSGGLLALNGERKLSLKSRGVKHLRLTLARVPSSQVNHLAVMNDGSFAEPQLDSLSEENIAHFHREIVALPTKNEYQAVYSSFDLTAALTREDRSDLDTSRGMFFLRVEGVEPRPKDDEEADDQDETIAKWREIQNANARRFLLVTDLGLINKVNQDHTRDIFVQSVSKGEPVAAATIRVLAKNGEFIAEAITDAQGHAVLPSLEGYRREKAPAAITARVGDDLAFMPFKSWERRMNTSRFDTDGLVHSEMKSLAAFVFTERGVYRPGDAVHVSGIVRRYDWQGEVKGLPIIVRIYDAKGDEVRTGELNLHADGFFDWSATIGENDPTGVYEVHVQRRVNANDWEHLGSTAFRVEDFQPDRMKMSAKLTSAPGLAWIAPEKVKGFVQLDTLFGTAAAKRRVKAQLDLSPAAFRFDEFADYVFHTRKPLDFQHGDEESSSAGKKVDLGEQQTDDSGKVEFDLALERFEGSFAMRFAAEGFEADGGRSVQAATATLVSPLSYVVGYKAPSRLDYIGQDTPLELKLICIGPDAKPKAAPALKARITRARFVSVLTKQANGNYEYVSTRRESLVSEAAFTLTAAGAAWTLPTNVAGEHRAELLDGDVIVSSARYSVVGKGDPVRSLERDAELEMKLARGDWNTGESIELSCTAPYTGAGLITIEREKVLGWQWFKSPTASSTQRILLPPGMEGTGYVNVAFVRALDSPEIFMSPLSNAVAPFTANRDAHRMSVKLTATERVKPGEVVRISYSSELPGRIVVFAVDEGIHQITNYKLPQPVNYFLPKRAHEVDTFQLLDLILPEFSLVAKQSAFGGDGDALRVNLNPFKRKKDAPVVYWSGLVESGPEARELSYTVPDYFDGTLKIMAVAVSAMKLGSAETKALVSGPMVLTPNVPLFAAPGDEFTASLSVANNMESGSDIAVKLEASEHLEFIDASELKLQVAPGQEVTTRVGLRAKAVLGGASLRFIASAGDQHVKRDATLSVRPAAPYLTQVDSGYFRLGSQEVKLSRSVFPHFRKAEAVASVLPLGLARGLESYLADYPHGCSEQITSRAMSRLLLMTEIDFGFDQTQSSTQIQSALRQLVMRQNDDGGFGYWGGYDSSDNLSVYVTHFLTEAKEAGHAMPTGLLDSALRRMKLLARGPHGSTDEQAAAIYLLTRNGQVTTNYALNLRDTLEKTQKDQWQRTVTGAYLAATYTLLQKRDEGAALMQRWWKESDHAAQVDHWYHGWFDDPQAKQSQGFALLCHHFPDIAKDFGADEIAMITDPIRANRFNTYTAAYAVLALKAFSNVVKDAKVKLTMEGITASGPTLLLPEGKGLRRTTFDPGLQGVRFLLDKNGSDLGAYYQVTESGFDRTLPDKAISDGLEITREWSALNLKVGESAKVTIRVRNNSPESLNDVAVLDLFAGGFMLAPNGLKPGMNQAGADYVDVREDRAALYTHLAKGETKTFEYAVKPVCAGKFAVPPVYAESMYDRAIKARTVGATVTVTQP